MEESKGNANLDGDWWVDLEDPRLDGFTFLGPARKRMVTSGTSRTSSEL
jgi:hypothetical protein